MGPVLVVCGGMIAVLVICSFLMGGQDRRERGSLDYGAMSEIESHDVDDMLDAINAYRRRAGRRDLGEDLGDEALRATWDDG